MRISSLFLFLLSLTGGESYTRFPTPTSSISVSPTKTSNPTNSRTSSITLTSSLSLSPSNSRTSSLSLTPSNSRTSNSTHTTESSTFYFSYTPSLTFSTETSTPSVSTALVIIPISNNGFNTEALVAVSVLGSALGATLLYFIGYKIINLKQILQNVKSNLVSQVEKVKSNVSSEITNKIQAEKKNLYNLFF